MRWRRSGEGAQTAVRHSGTAELPDYHPREVLRDWSQLAPGKAFRVVDAMTGVIAFGATGSGKTSGPAKHLATAYMAAGFGGLVLCAKKEERPQWEAWAEEVGRWDRRTQTGDLIIFDASAKWRFNFLDWEATRSGEGGGFTINIVAMLDEIAGAIAGGAGGSDSGGDNRFFESALHHMNVNLVELPSLAGLPVSLPLMRAIVTSAPQSLAEVESRRWQKTSVCAAILREAGAAVAAGSAEERADFKECRDYWLQEFPALSDKTRSIIVLSFSMLVRPLITRPLRALFSTSDTNVTPDAALDGKIIIIDLPVQEFRLAGRIANLAWKYCFQLAVMRRTLPAQGYLRPVFLWADEAQNFVTDFDAEYQAVARSAAGCTVYLTQNRESLRRVLGDSDAVDALLGNMQTKFFCQNSSNDTNDWASELLGKRWIQVTSNSGGDRVRGPGDTASSASTGFSMSWELRSFLEPAQFTTLRRGGDTNGFAVDAFVYKGGEEFDGVNDYGAPEKQPHLLLTFNQRS